MSFYFFVSVDLINRCKKYYFSYGLLKSTDTKNEILFLVTADLTSRYKTCAYYSSRSTHLSLDQSESRKTLTWICVSRHPMRSPPCVLSPHGPHCSFLSPHGLHTKPILFLWFSLPRSLGGFNVVDTAKAVLEAVCPGVVSCADMLVHAAHDVVSFQFGRQGATWIFICFRC
jgi:hypothetical protein